ncbi:DUF6461 domain-containing protein [Nonomuraea angiospora]|uniref:DUF6461 domain-containing protein n=1 Tax=Nonomuraea angiospora TaxID=46172 RepID=UPI0029BB7FBF|nr:DUF6461 domain-containing protein [Nonomuraea angiospora]MDX3103854.1 DUF6461 domain-containing protein [Nonomuraea angiospora]
MAFTYADVAWLAEDDELGDLWCLTFVRGVSEVEAILRLGADQESIRPLTYDELIDDGLFPETVLAGRAGDWTVLIEESGWTCAEADKAQALSAGTVAVAVLRHDYASDDFVYAVDGELVTYFNPKIPERRHGSDPDRLNDLMREAGLDPDDGPGTGAAAPSPTSGALLLAARLTGVVLTPDIVKGPLMSGVVG